MLDMGTSPASVATFFSSLGQSFLATRSGHVSFRGQCGCVRCHTELSGSQDMIRLRCSPHGLTLSRACLKQVGG